MIEDETRIMPADTEAGKPAPTPNLTAKDYLEMADYNLSKGLCPPRTYIKKALELLSLAAEPEREQKRKAQKESANYQRGYKEGRLAASKESERERGAMKVTVCIHGWNFSDDGQCPTCIDMMPSNVLALGTKHGFHFIVPKAGETER